MKEGVNLLLVVIPAMHHWCERSISAKIARDSSFEGTVSGYASFKLQFLVVCKPDNGSTLPYNDKCLMHTQTQLEKRLWEGVWFMVLCYTTEEDALVK